MNGQASTDSPQPVVARAAWIAPSGCAGMPLGRRLFWPLVRAYCRAELPNYRSVMVWYGITDHDRWAGAPTVETRGRFFRHRMRLDLSDYYQRINYFVGSYHEFEVLSALGAALRPGDVFVDGGANIGLVSIHAAALVGPRGEVHSFECSPRVLGPLRHHVAANKLSQVSIHPVGLSDAGATLTMRLPHPGNEAAATFSPLPERYGVGYLELGQIRVVRGDDALDPTDTRPLLIKLDVEGFELRALRGFGETIRRRRPAFITEINAELLTKNDCSPTDIAAYFAEAGYVPFAFDRAGFKLRHRLLLQPLVAEEIALEQDVMWLAEGSVHWQRLAPIMAPRRGGYWRHAHLPQPTPATATA